MKTFWNVLTILVLLLIVTLVIWGVATYINPYHIWNPFPPDLPETGIPFTWLFV